MVRFLHTGDWQLGMTRHFLSEEAQARFTAARFEAVARIGRIVAEEKCEFVVVAGDVFETNQVDRRTVRRALEAMAQIPAPVFLLPGNHDPLDAATVFRSSVFTTHCPPNVRVLADGTPVVLRDGVEVVGAPWTSKRPLRDLVAQTFAALDVAPPNTVRIAVAHGALDSLAPDPANPAIIERASAEALLGESKIHYLALGDRHSLTQAGDSKRIYYAGTPEPTSDVEVDPGQVLVVDCSPSECVARSIRVGAWRFLRHEAQLANTSDVNALGDFIRALPAKETTVLKLALVGTLSLSVHGELEELLDDQRHLFAAILQSSSRSELVVKPSDDDFQNISLSGFASDALAELRALAANVDAAPAAEDALGLLVRLAQRPA